ncbi:hypothetical protein NF634_002877 [Salmonella enterica]|nr:hypothetical protein [Salmonella enterica]
MKKILFVGSLIIGYGLFSMQASAMRQCEIILKPVLNAGSGAINRDRSFLIATYAPVFIGFEPGDKLANDAIVDFNWTQKKTRNILLDVEHAYYAPESIQVNTENELWATDHPYNMAHQALPGTSRILQEGLIKATGNAAQPPIGVFSHFRIYALFNGIKKPIKAPKAWCGTPEENRFVRISIGSGVSLAPNRFEMDIIRSTSNNNEIIDYEKIDDVDRSFKVRAPYEIVKKIGIDVPHVVDFGRVDSGVMTKKDIDVELWLSGISGRGRLTFNYAEVQKMEVIINEKNDPQEHSLPYSKDLNGLLPDTNRLTYQIGVKSDTPGDIEQKVRVTFNVF